MLNNYFKLIRTIWINVIFVWISKTPTNIHATHGIAKLNQNFLIRISRESDKFFFPRNQHEPRIDHGLFHNNSTVQKCYRGSLNPELSLNILWNVIKFDSLAKYNQLWLIDTTRLHMAHVLLSYRTSLPGCITKVTLTSVVWFYFPTKLEHRTIQAIAYCQ